jgi:hypothetical protein
MDTAPSFCPEEPEHVLPTMTNGQGMQARLTVEADQKILSLRTRSIKMAYFRREIL